MTRRAYENTSIRVFWDSSRCIHSGKCIRNLSAVFDSGRAPWVDVDASDAQTIADTVELCPTGALEYERLDGGPQETVPEVPVIVPRVNGPLLVHGKVRVQTRQGDVFDEGGRMALCRCGASSNQPFCDNSHRETRFRDNPIVVEPARERAANPDDISAEPQPDD